MIIIKILALIFGFSGIAFFVSTIIGLYAPSLLLPGVVFKKPTRLKAFLLNFGFCIVCFNVAGFLNDIVMEAGKQKQPERPFSGVQAQELPQVEALPDTLTNTKPETTLKDFKDEHMGAGYVVELNYWLKTNCREPESFKHIETTAYKTGEIFTVIVKYRARNGFGGYSIEYQKFSCSPDMQDVRILQ